MKYKCPECGEEFDRHEARWIIMHLEEHIKEYREARKRRITIPESLLKIWTYEIDDEVWNED